MQILRRALLVAGLACLLAPGARAMTSDDTFVIVLEHHWVVELAGQRFGLIEFDSPSTTVLLGGLDFDVPVPAYAIATPLLVLPALALAGLVINGVRRRNGFAL